ncbi:hypothetical protein GGI02_004893 [Coemansia sp. RSA 2322]|nr:hypothetical protein GGI02_004893 [Coemansia sp. RSA 2322]
MQCKNYGIAGISRNVTANYIEISKYREGEIYQYGVDVTPDHGAFDIPPPPAHMCLVFDAAMNAHRQGKLDGITMVYDAHTIAYASKRVCSPDETIELKIVFTEDGFTENYVIKLHETAVVNTSIVSEHMHGRGDVDMGNLQLALTALDLAIGSVLCLEMAGFSLSLFTHEQSLVTSGGLELWRGFSLSVRPGIDSLYLNVNIDATAIYPPGSLLDALMGLLGIRDPNQLCGRLTSQTVREIGPYLHHPVLHNKHSGIQGKQKFMVQGVTDLPLDQETIEWEDPEHKQCYKGKLDDRQAADLAKFACQRPGDYMNRILDILKRHRLSDSPAVQSFGLALHERLTEVESRVLPAPTVSYGLGSREPSFRPRDGVWNMRDKQVSRAAPDLMYWAVLVLANKQQTPLTKVQDFVTCLAETCRSTGYTVRNPRPSIVFGNPSGDIANQMEDVCKSI